MRRALTRLARVSWGREGPRPGALLPALLRPLSWAFAAAVHLRGRSYDRRRGARVRGVAVLSVGNLAVGGTGKTPLAAWLGRALLERRARPALVLRGYGRDEVALHRAWNVGVPVIVAPDRVEGVRSARDGGADVVVLDDAFQHRRLARDLDLVLLAVEDPLPVRLLPSGPYREPWSALARADGVVLSRRLASVEDARRLQEAVERDFPGLVLASVRLAVASWRELAGAPVAAPVGPALAVAAVARPEAFRAEVEPITGSEVEVLAFPDHHEFTARDARRIARRAGGRPVVVTEKDAVKLAALAAGSVGADRSGGGTGLGRVRVAVEALRWDWGEERVGALLDGLVRARPAAKDRGPPSRRTPASAASRPAGGGGGPGEAAGPDAHRHGAPAEPRGRP